MRGDKLIIEPHHTARAEEITQLLPDRIVKGLVLTVAGESGSGKSELASEIAKAFNGLGHPAGILQQDDYFVFPPKTNHEMRRHNISQVGPYEVKLDFLDSNLRSFKRGESPIYKPLVDYDADSIGTEEMDTSGLDIMVAEGTYTTLLRFADIRVFIARDYVQTKTARKRRGRDSLEPFVEDVLRREHAIISEHRTRADFIIPQAFDKVISG
jgi:uridine kinase